MAEIFDSFITQASGISNSNSFSINLGGSKNGNKKNKIKIKDLPEKLYVK